MPRIEAEAHHLHGAQEEKPPSSKAKANDTAGAAQLCQGHPLGGEIRRKEHHRGLRELVCHRSALCAHGTAHARGDDRPGTGETGSRPRSRPVPRRGNVVRNYEHKPSSKCSLRTRTRTLRTSPDAHRAAYRTAPPWRNLKRSRRALMARMKTSNRPLQRRPLTSALARQCGSAGEPRTSLNCPIE